MTSDETRALLQDAAARAINYLEKLDEQPVFPKAEDIAPLEKALEKPLPSGPSSGAEIIAFLDEVGAPATVANAGGRYFGFVTGGALPQTVAASWLASAWDQNSFGRISSPAIALIEDAALGWLKEALAISGEAEGALVTGATMANFTCLAAARHRMLAEAGWDVEKQGMFGAPEITVIVGKEVHATVLKVLGLLGLGRERVEIVEVDGQGRMRAEFLPKINGPAIICLQAGNVKSGAFDPALDIVPHAKARGAWVHVDGAFGLWAKTSDKLKHLAEGFEGADSWATDAHKWLNVPYDCGAAFVRDKKALQNAMSISGSYLLLGAQRDAIDVTPDSSRRARAIEVWVALKALGKTGLAELVERNCAQARWMAGKLQDAGFEVLNEVVLNQVVVSFGSNEKTAEVIKNLQSSGDCWCGGTTWQGRDAMRISFSSWATTVEDMQITLAAILKAAKA
ncbi:MAG: pyridoxal phosphate-dependent decarboxylase family protein [Hyphomicrobiales bacterium]